MCRQTYTQLKIDLHTDQRVVSGLDASLKSCIRYLLDFFLSSFTVILKLTLNSMLGYSRFSANVCLGFTLLIKKILFYVTFLKQSASNKAPKHIISNSLFAEL